MTAPPRESEMDILFPVPDGRRNADDMGLPPAQAAPAPSAPDGKRCWAHGANGEGRCLLPFRHPGAHNFAVAVAAPAPSAEPPATDAPCSNCGQTAGFHTLRCRDKNAASELRATHCSNEGLHDSAADLIEQQARALADKDRILERCRVVLGNMAQENVGAIFNRWPISHEPLRNDARGLLPDIDAVLGDSNG